MVADRDVDKVADMAADKCIKPEMFLNDMYWAEAVCKVYPNYVTSESFASLFYLKFRQSELL